MGVALIAAITAVLVAVITAVGQWIGSRNERATVIMELDILARLPEGSAHRESLDRTIASQVKNWEEAEAASDTSNLPSIFLMAALVCLMVFYAADGNFNGMRQVIRGVAGILFFPTFGLAVISGVKVLLIDPLRSWWKKHQSRRSHKSLSESGRRNRRSRWKAIPVRRRIPAAAQRSASSETRDGVEDLPLRR
jgi:hypothetical protein